MALLTGKCSRMGRRTLALCSGNAQTSTVLESGRVWAGNPSRCCPGGGRLGDPHEEGERAEDAEQLDDSQGLEQAQQLGVAADAVAPTGAAGLRQRRGS